MAELGAAFADHEVVVAVFFVHVGSLWDALGEAFPYDGCWAESTGLEVDCLLMDAGEVKVGRSVIIPEDTRVDIEQWEDERITPRTAIVGISSREEVSSDRPGR